MVLLNSLSFYGLMRTHFTRLRSFRAQRGTQRGTPTVSVIETDVRDVNFGALIFYKLVAFTRKAKVSKYQGESCNSEPCVIQNYDKVM